MKYKYVVAAFLVAYSIAITFVFVCVCCNSATQGAKNKVIIEQLCNVKPDSYWCPEIKK